MTTLLESAAPPEILAQQPSISLPSIGIHDCLVQLPLPGIVIFVHGVNSNGEWFDQAEEGLCKGLNARLARQDSQLTCPEGVKAGQLRPAHYGPELTPDGFINPKRDFETFIEPTESFSPVIRFRYGYKANGKELKRFGDAIFLNEQDYWGGGPFANGCTSLPDLWGDGLDADLFATFQIQHLNPSDDREVFSAPPRPYFVLAALRLARLIESIRRLQADVPITIVCHSQGNMVSLAAAFLGDRLPAVTDPKGKSGRCVADAYVLCNAPYSVLEANGSEDFAARASQDPEGRIGRQSLKARQETLKAFFEIMRERAPLQPPEQEVDRRMANRQAERSLFTAAIDRSLYGLDRAATALPVSVASRVDMPLGTDPRDPYGLKRLPPDPLRRKPVVADGSTFGRVTLYCNPHDQVISTTSIQGIGWRGMSQKEIEACGGLGVFAQRVFAQGFTVGLQSRYHFWNDRFIHPESKREEFWYPPSMLARYSIKKGTAADENWLAKGVTWLGSLLITPILAVAKVPVNGSPPKDWEVPLRAPDLPVPFKPQSLRYGVASASFDEKFDAPVNSLQPKGNSNSGDAYDKAEGERLGNQESESALRYENHAIARMWARREGLYKTDEKVVEEDDPEKAGEKYKKWQQKRLKDFFKKGEGFYATDHSTILTNPMHSEMALAYDVAVGICDITQADWKTLRAAADWRLLGGIDPSHPCMPFQEHFVEGRFKGNTLSEWVDAAGSDGEMPSKIVNERENNLVTRMASPS